MMSRVLPISLLLALAAPAAQALESAPVKTPHAVVTLVSDADAVEAGKPFRLGLRLKLAKGWHIYWVNPGDAGEPPHLDLTLPRGATASGISWPTPLRIPEGPVMTYAYLGEALLPVTVTPPADSAPVPISAKASWLICEKICVPEEGSLSLDLPAGAASPSAEARLFAANDERIPQPSPFAASLGPDARLTLAGAGISPALIRDAWFFPDKWGAIDDAAPQTFAVADGKMSLALKPAQTFDPKAPLSGVLVLKDAGGGERFLAVDATPDGAAIALSALAPATVPVGVVSGPAPAAKPAADKPAADKPAADKPAADKPAADKPAADKPASLAPPVDAGLATMLLFAFLGGLLLNLMPCVFPILAVKAVAIARLSGDERSAVRAHAASYTLGVLVAWLADEP